MGSWLQNIGLSWWQLGGFKNEATGLEDFVSAREANLSDHIMVAIDMSSIDVGVARC